MAKLPNRWGLILPWAIFAICVIGWTAYWFALSGEVMRRLEQAKAGLPDGSRLDYATASPNGFPFRMAVDLTEVRALSADGGVELTTPGATLAVNVVNPFHLLAFARSPLRVVGFGRDDIITAERIEASARLNANGLIDARVNAVNATVQDARAPQTPPARADQLAAAMRIDPDDPEARQVSLTANALRLGAPKPGFEGFGLGPIQLQAGVVVEQAGRIGAGGDPLGAWAQAGAKLRIEALEATWNEVRLAGKGAFTLDAERRPEGAMELTFEEPAKALQAVAQSSTLDAQGRAAAQALAIGQGLVGGGVSLSVAAGQGRWRFGPAGLPAVDLGPADPLYPAVGVPQPTP